MIGQVHWIDNPAIHSGAPEIVEFLHVWRLFLFWLFETVFEPLVCQSCAEDMHILLMGTGTGSCHTCFVECRSALQAL